MVDISTILNNLTEFFNNRNINFIIGGGSAISILSKMLNMDDIFGFNNLDIFYMANTPITPQYIHTYRRVQDCPHTSTTYITEGGFNINLTMIRNESIRCIKYNYMNNYINIMHPMILYYYYDDEINPTEIQISKMEYLEFLDTKIPQNIVVMEYKHNEHPDDRPNNLFDNNQNNMNEQVVRRLFIN
jgi:hypothetical protein